jgi:hypothetical protein
LFLGNSIKDFPILNCEFDLALRGRDIWSDILRNIHQVLL